MRYVNLEANMPLNTLVNRLKKAEHYNDEEPFGYWSIETFEGKEPGVHVSYDEEKKKIYEAHDAAMWEKYGRGIHAHEDAETGKELSSKLFMSDKKRPAWDLDYMMEIGFSKVFALKDISDISRTSMDRELNKLTPQFLVGGEK